MPKATIKLATGATITIEGTQEEVSSIISTYENTSVVGNAKRSIARVKSAKRTEKKRDSAAELIIALKENGFFEKPRSLGEIGATLEEQGYLYPVTSLSGVVLGLLKRKLLRRKKIDGKWVYGK